MCMCLPFVTQFQCAGMGGGSRTTKQFPTPFECPTTELSSDVIYQHLASDTAGGGLSPRGPLSTSDANHKSRSPVICASRRLTLSQSPVTISLGSAHRTRKPVCSPDYRFITKDIKGYTSTAIGRDTQGEAQSKGHPFL